MIRIGTRGSALALAQAAWVGDRLGVEYSLVKVEAAGPVGDKSRWVSELERALLAGEVDVAVHSAKDVPAELAPGLALVAIPAREDPRDALCGGVSLSALAPGARVGTSSLRRAAQIRAFRDDVSVVDLRGNVDTRLRKLASGECDALVLAVAGLARLGRIDAVDGVLDELVPAAGQGALAVEARPEMVAAVSGLVDFDATACVMAERELTRMLGASCNTPVGAYARVASEGSGDVLELTAWVGRPDGSAWIRDRLCGARDGLGAAVAERLLAAGAAELLS
ncbi:MAG: hydroxymethylbilane synthase [Solirubrobacteraceae bacterium]